MRHARCIVLKKVYRLVLLVEVSESTESVVDRHYRVIHENIYGAASFLYYRFFKETELLRESVVHEVGNVVRVVLVTNYRIRISELVQLSGNLGGSEEAEIEDTDGLVGHHAVCRSMQKELRRRSIGIFHTAMCRKDCTGK